MTGPRSGRCPDGVRVLVLTDWMTEPGGAEAWATMVRDGLRAAGDEVLLLACGAGHVDASGADGALWGTDRALPQSILQVANPVVARGVRHAVTSFRPEVALVGPFAYHLSPSALGALRGIPTVLAVMDYKVACPLGTKLLPDGSLCGHPAGRACRRHGCLSLPHWLRDRARYAAIRRAVAGVDVVLAPSRAVQEALGREGIASHRLALPVDTRGDPVRRAPAPGPLFVYGGRLSREKGVDLLLRAFARVAPDVPHARLRIVGDGAARAALEVEAAALGVAGAVIFRGRVPPATMAREMADAWALVAPSRWAEPYGLVVREAIANRVPVVASRIGGFAEVVEDGVTGLLVPNGDVDALAGALRAVAEGRAFPDHLVPAGAAAAVADRCRVDRYVRALRGMFAGVTGARP